MTLGLRQERRRRQRHRYRSAMRWLLAIVLIVGAGVYAYNTGARLAGRSAAALEREIAQLHETIAQLQAQVAAADATIAAEQARALEWRSRYEREVPAGEDKVLFDALRARMDEGLTAQRLNVVLDRMQVPQQCDASPQARRVQVQTPITRARIRPAAFDGGAVTVALRGLSARDAADNPEAWYDPAEPVTVAIGLPRGEVSETTGTLPLQPTLVHGEREYRFSIASAARGYVQVTLQRCRFP